LFLDLLDRHGGAVVSMLRRLCPTPHEVDDVFQDTALRAWRALSGRGGVRHPRAWLMTIAYRTALDHRAKRSKHAEFQDPPDQRLADPSCQAQRTEEHGKVNGAVAELPGPIRDVVVLHYTAGLTLRQTASTMGISVGTAKSRLSRGLKQLRKALS
jgi:RNA polymerase sigma-70 factor (ECF subfamily)